MIWTVLFHVLFLIELVNACASTATTTTTTRPCCPILTKTSLPRKDPSLKSQEQCSVLQRVSSSCPWEGEVICRAAEDTHPTSILIEFFDSTGKVVRSFWAKDAKVVEAKVWCVNGGWRVRDEQDQNKNYQISAVSCSQTGSKGGDWDHEHGKHHGWHHKSWHHKGWLHKEWHHKDWHSGEKHHEKDHHKGWHSGEKDSHEKEHHEDWHSGEKDGHEKEHHKDWHSGEKREEKEHHENEKEKEKEKELEEKEENW
uniref:Uncharacterized protein n=1 Tax=Caenorhabditis japonica TaxID=281687 RepID=A0A8R1DT92_CAEJA